jgi:Flp pilus assembly protein TadG
MKQDMKRDMKSFFRGLRGDQSGVVIILAALTMTSIVGFTGFAVDVGNVYYARSKLQAATDAAALAGAQNINVGSGGTAISTATSYSAVAGQLNASSKLPATMASGYPVLKCLTSTGVSCTGPDSANAIEVKQQATVPLYFGEVLGLSAWQISTTSLAGVKGGSTATQTLDVMIVLDTTASMNNADTSCTIAGATAEDCALAGIRNLLSYNAGPPISGLWPCSPGLTSCGAVVSGNVANPVDRVGLVVFPPLTNAAQIPHEYQCASSPAPTMAYYNASPAGVYEIIPLSSDYRTSDTATTLNTSSDLVIAARGGASGCQQGLTAVGGSGTFYADAITAAQAVLTSTGRPTAQKVIIMLSDGDANAGTSDPTHISAAEKANECHEGITAAQAATAAGTWVYSVFYSSGTTLTTPTPTSCSTDTASPISACSTMQQIASKPSMFFADPAGTSSCTSAANPTYTSLSQIFTQIATQASSLDTSARLLPLGTT